MCTGESTEVTPVRRFYSLSEVIEKVRIDNKKPTHQQRRWINVRTGMEDAFTV